MYWEEDSVKAKIKIKIEFVTELQATWLEELRFIIILGIVQLKIVRTPSMEGLKALQFIETTISKIIQLEIIMFEFEIFPSLQQVVIKYPIASIVVKVIREESKEIKEQDKTWLICCKPWSEGRFFDINNSLCFSLISILVTNCFLSIIISEIMKVML